MCLGEILKTFSNRVSIYQDTKKRNAKEVWKWGWCSEVRFIWLLHSIMHHMIVLLLREKKNSAISNVYLASMRDSQKK